MMCDNNTLLNITSYTVAYFRQEHICRLCWSSNADQDLYSPMSPLFMKVQNCLGIDTSQDNTEFHPKKICPNCKLKVEQFDKFKSFCQNSNEKLNTILNVNNKIKSIAKCPERIKLENLENATAVINEEALDAFVVLQHSELNLQNDIESPENFETEIYSEVDLNNVKDPQDCSHTKILSTEFNMKNVKNPPLSFQNETLHSEFELNNVNVKMSSQVDTLLSEVDMKTVKKPIGSQAEILYLEVDLDNIEPSESSETESLHSELNMKNVNDPRKSSKPETQSKPCIKTETINGTQHIPWLPNKGSSAETLFLNMNLEDGPQQTKPGLKKRIKLPRAGANKKKCSINNSQKNKSINNDKEPLESSRTRGRYKKRSPTYCNICNECFKDIEVFTKHNSEAHGIEKDGKFRCFGCDKLFKIRSHRLSHEKLHCKSLNNGYKCSVCNRYLPTRGTYENHMKDHRSNKVVEMPVDAIFKCNICDDQFTNKCDWKAHNAEKHAPKKNYVCETCGRGFSRLDYLNKHSTIHTGYRRYECPHCGFRSSQPHSLTIHIRKHTNERPYQCDLCPQRCISNSNLLAHRRRHFKLKKFQCPICNKKFGYKYSLTTHIAIMHECPESHSCAHCGSVYTRINGLRRHMRAKHPDEQKKNEKTNVPNSNISQKEQNVNEIAQGVLFTNINSENVDQGVLYPNEEDLHSKQKNKNVPTFSNELREEQEQFDLKIGENDKFVCFDRNFVTKDGENIIIVLKK